MQEGEHEMELLLNRREILCVSRLLVRWCGNMLLVERVDLSMLTL